MRKIAFQGRKGAYSDCAAHLLFGGEVETVAMDTFGEIYEAVAWGEVDGGAIPIENSTAGSIYENYDLLYKWRHPIVSEVLLKIEHALCAFPGTELHDLKRVLSHPQGLAQCSKFFAAHPEIEAVSFFDTAGSAEEIAKRRNHTDGAIASEFAARYYKLSVLKKGLENTGGKNFTRFYGIQKDPIEPPKSNDLKTTMFFELGDSGKPGALYRALGCFANHDLNLTRCESRPHPEKPWEYIFHVSFEGNPQSESARAALAELATCTSRFFVLGTFIKGKEETLKFEEAKEVL